jgi:hypothetical protein
MKLACHLSLSSNQSGCGLACFQLCVRRIRQRRQRFLQCAINDFI